MNRKKKVPQIIPKKHGGQSMSFGQCPNLSSLFWPECFPKRETDTASDMFKKFGEDQGVKHVKLSRSKTNFGNYLDMDTEKKKQLQNGTSYGMIGLVGGWTVCRSRSKD